MSKEKCLEKLSSYFEYKTSSLLQILDTPSETAALRGGYTGVTAGYLLEHVVPEADESLFLECINELMSKNIVARISCSDIDRYVFEKYKSDYSHRRGVNDLFTVDDLKSSGKVSAESYEE